MKEYKIITGIKIFVEELVNEHLERGWQCQGGITILPPLEDEVNFVYSQAMVREVNPVVVDFPNSKGALPLEKIGYIPVHMRVGYREVK